MKHFLSMLFASLALFSGGAFASEYTWNLHGRTVHYPSPIAACKSFGDIYGAGTTHTVRKITDILFVCTSKAASGNGSLDTNIYRSGDTCPVDFVFDTESGECVPPPHQCEVGDVIGPYKYTGVLSGGFVITTPPAPTSACKNGCEYSRKSQSNGCQTGHFGTFCSYEYVGTGVECTADPDNDMGGDSGDGPNANDGGDGGEGAGDGSDGGNNGDGGDDNSGNPQDDVPEAPPSSNAEGDAQESTLQEVKSVLGTLSKETTTRKIESGINKGNSLLGEIKDALNNLPNGGGGSGDGDGDEDAEPSAEVGSCSDALVCSGDAIQCAMLQVQKNQLCAYQITPEVEQQIKSVFEGEENQLETKEIAVGSLFTDGLNAARWLPSSCPVGESVTVMGRSYSISWQPLCTFASSLSALIVAMASIFFIVYLGKGLKGS